jgi:hypothetical protein
VESFVGQEFREPPLHYQSDDQIATIWDGTYSYIQKSLDNKFQRLTWCGHKGRHCVKLMVAIAGDGKIIDIFGSYPATDGDTVINRKVSVNMTMISNVYSKLEMYSSLIGGSNSPERRKTIYSCHANLPNR